MNFKRISLSLGMLTFAVAAVAGGTGAFFSDTETSSGNTFAAGAIDLKIDNVQHYNGMVCAETAVDSGNYMWVPREEAPYDADNHPVVDPAFDQAAIDQYNNDNPAQYPQAGVECTGSWRLTDIGDDSATLSQIFSFDDVKPGDFGESTISLHVENNDAYMCAAISNISDLDNGQTEPEALLDPDGDDAGELDDELNFFAWVDDGQTPGFQNDGSDEFEGDNIYQDQYEQPLGSTTAAELEDTVWAIAEPADGPISAEETGYIGVSWCFGTIVDGECSGEGSTNMSQTDSWESDLTFYIEQARNNDEFSCDDFAPEPPVVEPELSEASSTSSQGWSPVDLDTLGGGAGKEWFAKARNNNRGFEVAVGGSNDADRDDADTTWVAGAVNPFTLSYDGAGTATMVAGGVTTTYSVGAGSYGRIGVNVKAPSGVTSSVSNLALAGFAPLAVDNLTVVGSATNHILLESADFSSAWTLTGEFTFSDVGGAYSDENPAIQISID